MNSEFAPRFKFQDFSGGVEVALTSDQVKQIKFDEVKADQNLHTGYCFRVKVIADLEISSTFFADGYCLHIKLSNLKTQQSDAGLFEDALYLAIEESQFVACTN